MGNPTSETNEDERGVGGDGGSGSGAVEVLGLTTLDAVDDVFETTGWLPSWQGEG